MPTMLPVSYRSKVMLLAIAVMPLLTTLCAAQARLVLSPAESSRVGLQHPGLAIQVGLSGLPPWIQEFVQTLLR